MIHRYWKRSCPDIMKYIECWLKAFKKYWYLFIVVDTWPTLSRLPNSHLGYGMQFTLVHLNWIFNGAIMNTSSLRCNNCICLSGIPVILEDVLWLVRRKPYNFVYVYHLMKKYKCGIINKRPPRVCWSTEWNDHPIRIFYNLTLSFYKTYFMFSKQFWNG